jgi:predicted nuclease with TOPRIM domain
MELQVNDDVSNRLDKLDGKIDKLSEAIVAIARIEERVTTVLKQNDRFILRMDRLEDRVEIVEQKAIVNTKGVSMFERAFWIIFAGIVSIIVYTFK